MKRNFESLNEALDYYMKKHQVDKREDLLKLFENFNQSSKIAKPKYIYFNTLVLTKKDILNKLKEDGYVRLSKSFLKCDANEDNELTVNHEESSSNVSSLITKIKQIKNNEFVKDVHVKSMYTFASDSLLNKTYSLFQEGHLLQIDKSSCLVPLALNPPIDSFVIDAASAPGNKTILLSNIMKNTGYILLDYIFLV
jgi:16S rRNA C967 or C1407 C5-methylase (RsmB/RsmF family)